MTKIPCVQLSFCMMSTGRGRSPRRASFTTRRGPLRLINATTHLLETFQSTAPPYAILSHTWGSEELTLQELEAGAKTDSQGYHKVIGTCERALQDGFGYVWVDTCCIDKTDHAELSEAINSMFQWYQNAEVCYALLSDLDIEFTANHEESDEHESIYSMSRAEEESFVQSRYFTRGWTLQEMLAARVVHFFSNNGISLGDLRRLAEIVSRATNISLSLLSGEKSLEDFSIPQKLSWASTRTTTKPEDRAYSLLGLLNVSMTLRYGGGHNQFIRLQKKVLKAEGGIHILAWDSPDQSRPPSLFAESPDDFKGSNNVTSDPSVRSGYEIWRTNRGLQGSLPTFQQHSTDNGESGQYYIVLDCYEEHSPDRTLALRVKRLDSDPHKKVFAVDPATSNHHSSPNLGRQRLERLNFLDYASIGLEHVTLVGEGAEEIKPYDEYRRVAAQPPCEGGRQSGAIDDFPRQPVLATGSAQNTDIQTAYGNQIVWHQHRTLTKPGASNWQPQMTVRSPNERDVASQRRREEIGSAGTWSEDASSGESSYDSESFHSVVDDEARGGEAEEESASGSGEPDRTPSKDALDTGQRRTSTDIEENRHAKEWRARIAEGTLVDRLLPELPTKYRVSRALKLLEPGHLFELSLPALLRLSATFHLPDSVRRHAPLASEWVVMSDTATAREYLLSGHALSKCARFYREKDSGFAVHIESSGAKRFGPDLGLVHTGRFLRTLWQSSHVRIVESTPKMGVFQGPSEDGKPSEQWAATRAKAASVSLKGTPVPEGQTLLLWDPTAVGRYGGGLPMHANLAPAYHQPVAFGHGF